LLVEQCARLCYMSYGKGRPSTSACLANITDQKHFSVMEHANWTFIITGVSRSLTHELVRHRHLSFSQLSQRYVDESLSQFIRPADVPAEGPMYDEWMASCYASLETYKALVRKLDETIPSWRTATERRKMIRQAARSVLPNCTETKIAVTGNARAWREFFMKRNSPHADPEIRELARTIYGILVGKSPNLFLDTVEEE